MVELAEKGWGVRRGMCMIMCLSRWMVSVRHVGNCDGKGV